MGRPVFTTKPVKCWHPLPPAPEWHAAYKHFPPSLLTGLPYSAEVVVYYIIQRDGAWREEYDIAYYFAKPPVGASQWISRSYGGLIPTYWWPLEFPRLVA